jgi:hypothetical protein
MGTYSRGCNGDQGDLMSVIQSDADRREAILEQLRLSPMGLDAETLRFAVALQQEIYGNQALLNLIHKGEVEASWNTENLDDAKVSQRQEQK